MAEIRLTDSQRRLLNGLYDLSASDRQRLIDECKPELDKVSADVRKRFELAWQQQREDIGFATGDAMQDAQRLAVMLEGWGELPNGSDKKTLASLYSKVLSRVDRLRAENIALGKRESIYSRIARDSLSGVLRRLFEFLEGKKHKTSYEELRDSTIFTKADILNSGIKTQITRLIRALKEIDSPYVVNWSHSDQTVAMSNPREKPK